MHILLIRFAAGLVLLGGLLPTAVADNIVRLAAIEREPYAGATLPDQGYVPEVARAAFARSGYQVQTSFYPPTGPATWPNPARWTAGCRFMPTQP